MRKNLSIGIVLMVTMFCVVAFVVPKHIIFKLSEKPTTCDPDWKNCDNNGSMCRDASGNLWLIISRGGIVKECSWGVYKGTTMDNMVKQVEVDPTLKFFPRPYGDDTYWSGGLWIDPKDGKWYSPTHIEFNYKKFGDQPYSFQRRVCLTTSSDQGKTWKLEGDILTADNSYKADDYTDKTFYDQGPGDQHLVINGKYFYMFYMDAWVNKVAGRRFFGVRVARSLIKDKLAPGTWQKWYNGKWTEPGIGGRCSDVFNCGGTETANVFYSTYLKKYCALVSGGNGGVENDPDLFMSVCNNWDKMQWTKPLKISSAGKNGWYHWAVDSKTFSRNVIDGKTFRYYTSNCSVPRWFEVEITETDQEGITLPPVYPTESVNDGNPGWDTIHFPALKN